jgi:GST-like protein
MAVLADVFTWVSIYDESVPSIKLTTKCRPMCGNFGHFYIYAPADKIEARDYGVARYGMEVQRLLDVLEKHLKDRTYIVNEEYTIADICSFPWVRGLVFGNPANPATLATKKFLSIEENYPRVVAWMHRILERPAVQRGVRVCEFASANTKPWLDTNQESK